MEYARFADDLVVLVDAHPRHAWLKEAVPTRLRQELATLQVEVNEEKSTTVELARGESFGFLGFEFRRIRARSGAWLPQYTPKLKKRTALLQKLKDVFRRFQSQPVSRVIELINPILRGWVNYFSLQPVLLLHPRLGREEDQATHSARSETPWLRLDDVE